jgi:CO/xanthine dehydrogenase Mo-binding subunit
VTEPTQHRFVSKKGPIREDRRFVTGRGRFVADVTPAGTLHVALVPSPHAHAKITAIDASAATQSMGLVSPSLRRAVSHAVPIR